MVVSAGPRKVAWSMMSGDSSLDGFNNSCPSILYGLPCQEQELVGSLAGGGLGGWVNFINYVPPLLKNGVNHT